MSETRELTTRQAEVLACIRRHVREYGVSPTLREIGLGMKIKSPNGVVCHVKALEKKGAISRGDHRARSIRLVQEPVDVAALMAQSAAVIGEYDDCVLVSERRLAEAVLELVGRTK